MRARLLFLEFIVCISGVLLGTGNVFAQYPSSSPSPSPNPECLTGTCKPYCYSSEWPEGICSDPVNDTCCVWQDSSNCTSQSCLVDLGTCNDECGPGARKVTKYDCPGGGYCEYCAYSTNCDTVGRSCETVPATGCGGGSCGCGESRVSTTYCPATGESSDECVLDASCGNNCGGGGGGSPTPTNPPGGYCGNGICAGAETCTSCPIDCGACPSGDIQVRASRIASTVTTCSQVRSSTNYIAVDADLTGPNTANPKTTLTNGSWVQWNNLTLGTWGVSAVPTNPDDVLRFACRTTANPPLPASTWTNSASVNLTNNALVSWNLGFTAGAPWVQVRINGWRDSNPLIRFPIRWSSPSYATISPPGNPA
jgi:hypothetical protein